MLPQLTIEEFLEELAARKPTPGGGSVAALAGALSAGSISKFAPAFLPSDANVWPLRSFITRLYGRIRTSLSGKMTLRK